MLSRSQALPWRPNGVPPRHRPDQPQLGTAGLWGEKEMPVELFPEKGGQQKMWFISREKVGRSLKLKEGLGFS